jgi:hypothetical protein
LVQILRHSKIAITMEICTEVVSSATREAFRKLGDQTFSLPSIDARFHSGPHSP